MKKNLMSVIILALLLVNVVLTGIMMFSTMNQTKKSTELISKIAEAVDLELDTATGEEGLAEAVSIKDTDVYVIPDSMTIPLASSGDGKDHYFIVTVSLSLNKNHEDYLTFGTKEDLDAKQSLIKSEIASVIGKYTLEYVKENQTMLCDEILERLRAMYDSDFVFGVTFSDPLDS